MLHLLGANQLPVTGGSTADAAVNALATIAADGQSVQILVYNHVAGGGANGSPTKIGKRIAKTLTMSGLQAYHERDVVSVHSAVRADVFVESSAALPTKTIVELKAFSPSNTMPSAIRDQVRQTLRRHAQFAGFLAKQ